MTRSEYIQNFRKEHQLSRNMLAYYIGCSPNLVARLEDGMEPSPEWWDMFSSFNQRFSESSIRQAEEAEMEEDIEQLMMMDYASSGHAASGEAQAQ